MADQNDNEFGFEEESFAGDEFTIEESAPVPEPETELTEEAVGEFEVETEDEPEPEDEPRKSSMARILLLVLLLVLAGGGYFFLATDDSETAHTPVQTSKQPISLPVTQPVKPAPPKPVVAETPAAPAVPVAPVMVSEEPVKPAEAKVVEMAKPEDAAAEADKADIPVPVAVAEPAAPVASPEPEPAVASGAYSVQVGAYVLQSNLRDAQKKAAQTGYPSTVEEAHKLTPMTRLLLGRFAPDEAERQLAVLKEQSPGAFKIVEGEQVAVYAGSYTSIDKARRTADLLYEKGLSLNEVSAEVAIPLFKLKLGPFADRGAAEKAAQAAEAAGLPTQVVKKPVK